jgi:nucleotide-binding universal stress UspA family protein
MHYKTILLIANTESGLGAQLNVAIPIAMRASAHLVGLAVLPPQITIPAGTPGQPDVVYIEGHRRAFRRETDRMRAIFTRRATEQRLSFEWILDDANQASELSLVLARSHAADLVIIDGTVESKHSHMTGRLVINAGRPVILVPRPNTHSEFGERILVAWNGAREASRATFDAIPLLKSASHVKVLRVNHYAAALPSRSQAPAQLCGTLARHDIHSEPEEIALAEADVGPALLAAVKAENADLLVMGCYGHSRLRELALGGASRHVLHHMSVPVFMSH